jgi:hypothetical protein
LRVGEDDSVWRSLICHEACHTLPYQTSGATARTTTSIKRIENSANR